jgi:hypothetical protein
MRDVPFSQISQAYDCTTAQAAAARLVIIARSRPPVHCRHVGHTAAAALDMALTLAAHASWRWCPQLMLRIFCEKISSGVKPSRHTPHSFDEYAANSCRNPLQSRLCAVQHFRWQAEPQYGTTLHPPHVRGVLAPQLWHARIATATAWSAAAASTGGAAVASAAGGVGGSPPLPAARSAWTWPRSSLHRALWPPPPQCCF